MVVENQRQNSILMNLNNMLLSGKTVCALAIGALLITSCSKNDFRRSNRNNLATTDAGESSISATATAGYKTFSFTEIPFGNTDLVNPGRGAEQWHNAVEVNVPDEGVKTTPYDVYYRFVWTRIEGATQGSYNWTYFDNLVNNAIAKKQKLSFGIMTSYPEGTTNEGLVQFDGGYAAYPLYLHKLMQSESVKDWKKGSTWTPNYNSSHYHARLLALHQAINQRIISKGWEKVIQFIDIRGYGSWGEWNSSSLVNHTKEYPSGTFPTAASLKKIVDAHTKGFPNFPLVAMIAAFDAGLLGIVNNPPEIAHYILTTRNNWGPIGWRRDQWGATDQYLKDYLENNNRSYNGVVLKNLIMERWKTAPITGEPAPFSNDMADLERQVRLYHATSFGNGNYGNTPNSTVKSRVRAASKATGYRFKIINGEYPSSINRNVAFNIKTNWQNIGLAPTYENWDVVYELQTSTGAVKWTGKSTKVMKLFLPATSGSVTTDKFVVPSTVPAGTYKLVVRVKDPNNYRPNIQLAINGKNADGSYTIASSIAVK